ncbi:MAG: ribosomal protein S18-alanine N-acetyltransferase [Oscillatoriales cyanobacterium RM2_1_1]|nr:ribosomal protein S18-alanine N-acetyltransferase [Oscillatoriales cyanobacterium SM2_3_0]NJO45773.1 ribosomal protein S18-alanine N-acetyltransferase [Oscillatoriales cyanobacterium RM2_1_1]
MLNLQPLQTEHLLAAVELDQSCLGGLWTLEGYRRELESPNSDLLGWIRSTDPGTQSIVGLGCLWAILEEAHITLLAIHPDYQGQGLGQAMLYALLHSAWQRGLERATLEVRASNQPALSLYEKFGFNQAGRRKAYYQNPSEDALILWRNGLHYPDFLETLGIWRQQLGDRLSSGSNLISSAILSEISLESLPKISSEPAGNIQGLT